MEEYKDCCCTNTGCMNYDKCGRVKSNNMYSNNVWTAYAFIEPEAIDYCRYFISIEKIENDYFKNKDLHC